MDPSPTPRQATDPVSGPFDVKEDFHVNVDQETLRKLVTADLAETLIKVGLIAFLAIVCVRIFAPFANLIWINAGTTALVLIAVPFLPSSLMDRKDRDRDPGGCRAPRHPDDGPRPLPARSGPARFDGRAGRAPGRVTGNPVGLRDWRAAVRVTAVA